MEIKEEPEEEIFDQSSVTKVAAAFVDYAEVRREIIAAHPELAEPGEFQNPPPKPQLQPR